MQHQIQGTSAHFTASCSNAVSFTLWGRPFIQGTCTHFVENEYWEKNSDVIGSDRLYWQDFGNVTYSVFDFL